jgi:sulfur-oxidizing protein SoxA
VTLQKQISRCRDSRAGAETLPTNHPDLVALETFVRNRASGEVVNVQTDGPVTELLKQGEKLYKTRYGLIDMACNQCHDVYPGQMIRGQKISQGQANGFPAYRLDTGEMANLHQRIQQCLGLMRAEPFDADSEEIKLLGLYIMSRSNGLRIETPAVRY